MRPFEWLLLISFMPVLLVPFVPPAWRRRWFAASAPLPALSGMLHLLVEGWRIQMLPVYLCAMTGLVIWLAALTRQPRGIQPRRGVFLSLVAALVLILCGVFAGWAMPVISLPVPTGPYPVGIIDREVIDQARGRRLMVSVWYPAAGRGSPAPLTHHPDEVATGLGNLTGLPDLAFQNLRYAHLSASDGAPIALHGGPFPVLVFSHGMVGLRLQNSSTMQDLASWGYVVVAVDHTHAAAVTVFPDGEASYYNLAPFGVTTSAEAEDKAVINARVFPVWVADQRFLYDTLETWEASDPLLAGKLDLGHIGSFGHSFGGATALEVCRVDPRCLAAVDLDGGLYGEVVSQPAVRQLLLMSSSESSQYTDALNDWSHLVANAKTPAYWLVVPNSTHFSFTIMQLLSPLLVPKGFEPRAGLATVDKYLRIFFDHTLRDGNGLPARPDCGTNDVIWHTKSLCE